MNVNESLYTLTQNGHVNPALEIADGQFLFRGVTEGGTTVEKLVSPAAVREAFTNIPVDSGWLTPNLSFGGVVRWGVVRGVDWVVMFLPASVHSLELTEADGTPEASVSRIDAPLPGMVMFGAGSKYFVWAVKTRKLEPLHEVYRAPLPNVMQDASICWGTEKPPHATGKSIAAAWELFAYRTTFNNHMAGGKSKSDAEDVRRVLRRCAAEGVAYPVGDLMRQVAQVGVTLDDAIKNFFEVGAMQG